MGLYQSRSGMIAKEPVQGRITSMVPTRSRWRGTLVGLQGDLEDEFGHTHHFRLTRRDAVFVRRQPAGVMPEDDVGPDPAAHVADQTARVDGVDH
ncbi:hypothetical protein GCM10009841_02230 [Microlunatus panaciterrae]